MTVHLVKLCVGATSLADLEDWVTRRVAHNKRGDFGAVHDHVTRMVPKRRDELLEGGSIYWVIKGVILARQRIVDLQALTGADGIRRCAILLDPPLVPTAPTPRKAFQGWRYLSIADAPPDVSGGRGDGAPPELAAELAALGLL